MHQRRIQNNVQLKSGTSWIHETTSRSFTVPKPWRPCCRQTVYFDVSLQFATHVHLHATSNENIRCKRLQWIKNGKRLETSPAMDIFHIENAELEPKLQKYEGGGGAPGRHCKRRLRSLCSFYRTGLVCVPDDCCRKYERYCKIMQDYQLVTDKQLMQYRTKLK